LRLEGICGKRIGREQVKRQFAPRGGVSGNLIEQLPPVPSQMRGQRIGSVSDGVP
jgi:hypothetical protein